MIYIFDDRIQRRKDNEEKLRSFSDLITFDTVKLIPGKSADESIYDSIKNPECIIFHKSYALGDENVTVETIRQLFTSFDIPIVIFSGGTEGSNKSTTESKLEINMNADLMYANLPYFLENYRANGQINIDTLLWGKRHKLNAMLQFQNRISQKYLINNNYGDIVDAISDITRTIEMAREINDELRTNILADIKSHEHITWLEFANIIDNQIEKYK